MDGFHNTTAAVSGSDPVPVVDLAGTSMSALVFAIPAILSRTGRPAVVIGGLAVVCRLTRPHRVTSDLDTVNRRATGEAPQLQLLVASGASACGVYVDSSPIPGPLRTSAG